MKKLIPLLLVFAVLLAGCNGPVMVAHLSEGTQALSSQYVVRVVTDKDDRFKDKGVDVQVMSSKPVNLNIAEEEEDAVEICIEDADVWYNLTVLLADANQKSGQETYVKFEEYGSRNFIFTTEEECCLKFRAVAGNITENQDKTGQILTSSEEISNELEIKTKSK